MDETLLHTIVRRDKGGKGRTWIKLDGLWHGSQERPCASELIGFCRDLAPTRILTTATADYARFFLNEFNFFFAHEEIITRYEYIIEHQRSGGWMDTRIETEVINHRNEPNAILIDNMFWSDNTDKMTYLGIDSSRYIKIREYLGGDDPEKFYSVELPVIKDKLMELVSEC